MLCVALAACSAAPTPTASPLDPTLSPTQQPSPTVQPSTGTPTNSVASANPSPPPTPSPTVTPSATASVTPTPTLTAPAPSASPITTPSQHFKPNSVALTIERYVTDPNPLTYLTHAGDGTGLLYVVEQRGVVRVLDAQGKFREKPFLDISERTLSIGDDACADCPLYTDQGLLGIAFHPGFDSNGKFFVDYTDNRGNTVVSEFTVGADGMGDPSSERILVRAFQPYQNHNGGMIAFGPDGYLYIALGDGGSGGDPRNVAQRLNKLLGKVLRIDVDSGDPYGIPEGNPFVGDASQPDAQPEIWSYGLRNPWRFSFDRLTRAMFIGDVGQYLHEEVDVEPLGQGGRNYGWRIMEGDACYERSTCRRSGLTLPVATYDHGRDCAIIGGYVYRGSRYPALFGAYLFADYCSGRLMALDADAALADGHAEIFELGDTTLNPASFGEDEAGEIYVIDHMGAIYHVIARQR